MLRNWRTKLEKQIPALSAKAQIAGRGLLGSRTEISPGAEALADCSTEERGALWAVFFPALCAEVEIAWQKLSPMVVARRVGGWEDFGDRFTWPPGESLARTQRFAWLMKLLIITGPFPKVGFVELLARTEELIASLRSSVGDDRVSFYRYDSDAPAFLAVPILNRGRRASGCLHHRNEGIARRHSRWWPLGASHRHSFPLRRPSGLVEVYG